MLRSLARVALRTRLVIVGTYRETDLDRRHPFAAAFPWCSARWSPPASRSTGWAPPTCSRCWSACPVTTSPPSSPPCWRPRPTAIPSSCARPCSTSSTRGGCAKSTVCGWPRPASISGIPGGRARRHRSSPVALLSRRQQAARGGRVVRGGVPADRRRDGHQARRGRGARRNPRGTGRCGSSPASGTFDHYAFTHALFGTRSSRSSTRAARCVCTGRSPRRSRRTCAARPIRRRRRPSPATSFTVRRFRGAERGVPYALAVADDAAARYVLTRSWPPRSSSGVLNQRKWKSLE